MTAYSVVQAFNAAQENLSRLAWRTAYFHRVQAKQFPRTEDAIFARAKPVQRQSIQDQYAMAKLMTQMLSTEKH
jgi:hypothetical protein